MELWLGFYCCLGYLWGASSFLSKEVFSATVSDFMGRHSSFIEAKDSRGHRYASFTSSSKSVLNFALVPEMCI